MNECGYINGHNSADNSCQLLVTVHQPAAKKSPLSQQIVQYDSKNGCNNRNCRRSPALLSCIAAVPVITEAKLQVVIVWVERVVVASFLAVVMSLDSWYLLTMFLTITQRHEAFACQNNIGYNITTIISFR